MLLSSSKVTQKLYILNIYDNFYELYQEYRKIDAANVRFKFVWN